MAKQKRRSFLEKIGDGLLTLLDAVFSGIGHAFAALVRLIFRGIWQIVRLICKGILLLLHWMFCPVRHVFNKLLGRTNSASKCLRLTGEEFEIYVADILKDNGFRHVRRTPLSGDQGVDILCERNGRSYAIQCKNYQGAVGNAAVQEAYAGMQFYNCDLAVVICPGKFTASARELADATGVLLWGEQRLGILMQKSGKKPRRGYVEAG